MANAKTRTVTLRSIITNAAFRKGYEEAKKGLPLDPDAFDYVQVWNYERGRQFAMCFNGVLKHGARVSQAAAWSLGLELHNKSII